VKKLKNIDRSYFVVEVIKVTFIHVIKSIFY